MDATEVAVGRARRVHVLNLRTSIRATEIIVGGLLLLLVFQVVLNYTLLNPALWSFYWSRFTSGIALTLRYTALIIPVSLALGFALGLARISRFRFLSWPVAVYVDFFRGIPPVVIVIFASLFGLELIPDQFGGADLAITLGALALAFHSAAYQAEIFRAGFQSVPRGQLEAAQALGMRSGQSLQSVVLPQALRLSLPPLGNEFAVVIKDTSLLAAIGAFELFGWSLLSMSNIAIDVGDLSLLFTMWTAVALAYFVMTSIVTGIISMLERRYHTPGLEATSI